MEETALSQLSPTMDRLSLAMCAATTPTWALAPLLLCPLHGNPSQLERSPSSKHSVHVSLAFLLTVLPMRTQCMQ